MVTRAFDLPATPAYRCPLASATFGAVALSIGLLLAPLRANAAVNPAPTIHLVLGTHPPRTLQIDVAKLFHTLTVDFFSQDDGTVYVQTGDIPAMWLRDSSAQTLPYVRFAPLFPNLAPRIRGVIERNAKNVLTDPYANAFTSGYVSWEDKWEVDSLAYPVTLAWTYWQTTGDRAIFTRHFHWAMAHTVSTYECEQHHLRCSRYRSRMLRNGGEGAYYARTGMIWGAFRPSDDPVRYPYNIPQQMFAAVALEELATLVEAGYHDEGLAYRARVLGAALRAAIERYGVVYDFRYGWMYAYEVDGYGNSELMDDANVPNLISIPTFGFESGDDALYRTTRAFALSTDNPFFYRGAYAVGLGSSHTPTGWVWPLGMMARALTAGSWGEVEQMLTQLRASGGAEALFHESLDPDRPWRFTRTEFGWANASYAELLFRSIAGFPPEDPLARSFSPPAKTPQMPDIVARWENAGIMLTTFQRISGSL